MKKDNWIYFAIGVGSLILMGITLYYNYNYATSLACDQQGIFGDMFGASNAFFTGLSFTGLIITILLQRQELRETREEFKTQNNTLKLQQFENTFFQMLNMFHHNTESQQIRILDNSATGKDVFNLFVSNLNGRIRSLAEENLDIDFYNRGGENQKVDDEIINLSSVEIIYCFNDVRIWYDNIFYSYFSTLNIVLNLLDKAKIQDKELYSSIVKSQLTESELIIIFYKCISDPKNSKFNTLIKVFGILENLKKETFSNRSLDLDLLKFK